MAVAAVKVATVTAGRPVRSHWQRLLTRYDPGGRPWWRDVETGRAPGWRQLTVLLGDEVLFEVDYRVCRRCRLGWIDHPATCDPYQRLGLASAALAVLRQDYPGLSWATGGGHGLAPVFWMKVGFDVPGGYASRADCQHGWKPN